MYLTRLKHLKRDDDTYLRHYIRYLTVKTRTEEIYKKTNLNSIDREKLKHILMEQLSRLTDAKIEDIERGNLKNGQISHIDEIIKRLISIRDSGVSFENDFSWVSEVGNKRSVYFICTMLKLILNGDDNSPITHPAVHLAPKRKIKYKNIKTNAGTKYDTGEHNIESNQGEQKLDNDSSRIIEEHIKQKRLGVLFEILNVCPNKTKYPLKNILELCEQSSFESKEINSSKIKACIKSIEISFSLVHVNVNDEWEIFTTEDENMINWLYKKLINTYNFEMLSPALNIESKKHSIVNIVDVLYITHSREEFNLEIKRIKDAFSRKKATTEKVDMSLDRARWEKLKVIASGKSDAKAMAALNKLIDEAYKDRH